MTEQVKRLEGTEMGVGAERLPFDTAEYLSQVTAQKNGAESAMQVLVDAGVKGAPPLWSRSSTRQPNGSTHTIQ